MRMALKDDYTRIFAREHNERGTGRVLEDSKSYDDARKTSSTSCVYANTIQAGNYMCRACTRRGRIEVGNGEGCRIAREPTNAN